MPVPVNVCLFVIIIFIHGKKMLFVFYDYWYIIMNSHLVDYKETKNLIFNLQLHKQEN
ncbi:hypothetical protein MTJW_01100 [Moorella thermoacetica]|nr:hypothetical protein MTJW_01100 [Moorella thermoacetica]